MVAGNSSRTDVHEMWLDSAGKFNSFFIVGSDFTEKNRGLIMCVMFYCKLHKHNCTVTPAHLCITTISGAGLMHCVGPSACIVWQGGNSARKGQVSTRFLGYPQYFEINTATLHISPILRRHNMGTWFSVVTTIGYKWVYNVGSPSLILQHTDTQNEWQGRSGGPIPCSQVGKHVEVWKTARHFAVFQSICRQSQSFAGATLQRRRYALCTTSGRTRSRVLSDNCRRAYWRSGWLG